MTTQFSKKTKHGHITSVNAKVARNINRSIILNSIRRHQPVSRAVISELTKLNKSTVSSIVESLVDESLVSENPDLNAGVGRRPVNLHIRTGQHFVGAIFFDAPVTRVAVVDIDGTIQARDEINTPAGAPEELVARCIGRLNELRSRLGGHRFRGIGASVAGIVDSTQSKVIYAVNLGWDNVELGNIIHDQMPEVEMVSVENDAKASALAELLLGSHQLSASNLVFLSVGAGIGAGIVVNGRILSGSMHAAGEIGHMTVVDGGEQCPCGNTGCWELYASERAPVRGYHELKKSPADSADSSSLENVMAAARAGDTDALLVLRRWAQHVGVGIGNLICTCDPDAVVVGGQITRIWDIVYPDINESAQGSGVFARQHRATILPASLSDNPALMGAAALSIRKIFTDYTIAL